MHDSQEKLDPDNAQQTALRKILRRVGPILIAVGAVFFVIGLASFFKAFGSHGSPRYFWCAFVGMPVAMIGFAICKFAYMGDVLRYMARETAPVGKDTFNYMAEGTAPGVRTMAAAVREGFSGNESEIVCQKCQAVNPADANFCPECGISLKLVCPECSAVVEHDANFCDQCGFRLDAG